MQYYFRKAVGATGRRLARELNAQERWLFWVGFEKDQERARGQRDSTAVRVERTSRKGQA